MVVYLGIDLGTRGCRVMAVRDDGSVVSSSYQALEYRQPELPSGWSEQDADKWWCCVRSAARKAMGGLPENVAAVCVDSTSGTLLAIDREGRPLIKPMMYNDGRAIDESLMVSEAGRELEDKLGYRVRPSFAIAKLLWLKRNRKTIFDSTYRFVHAADYIAGKLVGDWTLTDHSNALKSCFDLIDYRWPEFFEDLGIPVNKMPSVVPPGSEMGHITDSASKETGIRRGTRVLAGLTDGCASQIASGAAGVGDWETTLGTTLVVKGVTKNLLKDPHGRIYSHLHPQRFWMPGGASSTGGECLASHFPDADLAQMDQKALGVLPTGLVVYPLVRRGERFPFVAPDAEGFTLGNVRSNAELYAAQLEGVAYVEKMAYDTLEELGAHIGGAIYTAGGGSKSRVWLQVRANVLCKTVLRPLVPEAAMGSAILAASSDLGLPLDEAAGRMVRVDLVVHPDEEASSGYEERYERFRFEIIRRFGSLY